MDRNLFKILCDNFNKELNRELYELYNNELQDYDPILVKNAVMNILKNKKYFPNLADIKEEIKKLPPLYELLTEKEKIKRWQAKGIKPKSIYIEEELGKMKGIKK